MNTLGINEHMSHDCELWKAFTTNLALNLNGKLWMLDNDDDHNNNYDDDELAYGWRLHGGHRETTDLKLIVIHVIETQN